MSKIVAQISTSLDGYVSGPDDRPGRGLGTGGERLHYWIFGGPWTYDEEPSDDAEPTGVDKERVESSMADVGAVIGGRGTYDAADAWGGSNPWAIPFVILTHRVDDVPAPDSGFTFVDGLDDAVAQAKAAAGVKTVSIMGGADVIRQALRKGLVDELTISIAPVVLGGGKRLFDGFEDDVELEHVGVSQSTWATHVQYRVKRR